MSTSLQPTTRLIAHRGNAFEFPENTLPALQSALELGVHRIEFDVHLSADGIPVVMHDDRLNRCAGLDLDALAMRWDELKTISVHEPSRLGERFVGTTIPSLAEVVNLLKQSPKATAFVEIKRASLRRFGTDAVVRRVCEQLQTVANQVVVISFDLDAVLQVKLNYALPIGWVLSEYSAEAKHLAETHSPNFLFCNQDKLPNDHSILWPGVWRWAIYEVTNLQEANALIARGARLLETMQVRSLLHGLDLNSPRSPLTS
jgi:glycerophosphoryl diester phosphodiesterase